MPVRAVGLRAHPTHIPRPAAWSSYSCSSPVLFVAAIPSADSAEIIVQRGGRAPAEHCDCALPDQRLSRSLSWCWSCELLWVPVSYCSMRHALATTRPAKYEAGSVSVESLRGGPALRVISARARSR
jgi:hypothetical protein